MNGMVTRISGATVCVDLPDLKIGDRVFVGVSRLTGEVVRLEGQIATASFLRRFPKASVVGARFNGRINLRGLDRLVCDLGV